MAETVDPTAAKQVREQQRDRWTALAVFLFCWVLFVAAEQSPFSLQGAVVAALVERGRLYFVRGSMKETLNESVFGGHAQAPPKKLGLPRSERLSATFLQARPS